MSNQKISAVCFDVFGTLLTWRGRRINPYLRLAQNGQRLPFMTRDVPIEVFAEELGLSHLVPVIQHELAEDLKALQLFQDVDLVLRKLRGCGMQIKFHPYK